MARLLKTLFKLDDKKKREKITEYMIYHNYDMEFLETFDGKLDYDTVMKYDYIFDDWYGINQTQRNFEKASAIIPLAYEEFCINYPQFKNYIERDDEHFIYDYIMPERVEFSFDTDALEKQAEVNEYLDQLMIAAEIVTENYGMQDKIDVEDIIMVLGEPFLYLRQLLTYLTVFGFTITRGDCTWEYLKIPYISSSGGEPWNPKAWYFVNLDRPIVDPTSIRYVNPNG